MAHKQPSKANFSRPAPVLIAILMMATIHLSAGADVGRNQAPKPSATHTDNQGNGETLTPQDNALVKLDTKLVSVRVTVTDQSGRAIAGLSKDDFKIYEDKIEQPVSFFSDDDAPASVAIVFDTSNSMSDGKIIRAREALARFIQTSHEHDEYFLISFGSIPRLLLNDVHDGQAVLDRINKFYPAGQTALYDAVLQGLEETSRGNYAKRAIILISDGEDNHSQHSFGELRRRLRESDVAVYSIGIAENSSSTKIKVTDNSPFLLESLAAISGGKSFWPGNAEKMNEAFEQIALELRRQYSLGYLPSNFVADGKWRRIKVTVKGPDKNSRLIVRSREGFYANIPPKLPESPDHPPEDHGGKLGKNHQALNGSVVIGCSYKKTRQPTCRINGESWEQTSGRPPDTVRSAFHCIVTIAISREGL